MSTHVNFICVAYKNTLLAYSGINQKQEKQFCDDIPTVLSSYIDKDNMRAFNEQSDMNFGIQIQNQVMYLAFVATTIKRPQCYGMLQDIAHEVESKYSTDILRNASSLQLQRDMGGFLQNAARNVQKYNSQTQQLQQELQEVKGIVMDNVNKVMQRASALEEIENDAVELKNNALDFKTSSNNLRKAMLCKKISIIIGVIAALVIVLVIIIVPQVIKK